MASTTTQPLDVAMDATAQVTTQDPAFSNSKAEEAMKIKMIDPVAEEKKQADAGEEDEIVTSAATDVADTPTDIADKGQVVMTGAPNGAPKSSDSGSISPTEAPKQTLNGEAARSNENSGDSPLSPNSNNQAANNNNDDEDSSNDDSSYFADPHNLPSPGGAHRKYSFSSNLSTGNINKGRESDASLSLSDDSDDENKHGTATFYGQPGPEVFPHQRITRMHSVGSLVSTSSQNTEDDPAVRSELRQAAKERAYESQTSVPSGHLSPSQGPHLMYPPHGYQQQFPHGSPPAILPDNRQYQFPQGFPHPQPQLMSQQHEQWMAGATASNVPPPSGSGGGIADGRYNEGGATGGNGGGGSYQNGGNGSKQGDRQESRDIVQKQNRGMDVINPPSGPSGPPGVVEDDHDEVFKVYWQRWIMLMYMSLLNLLSDWTCYSVAPIALLTKEAFGDIDPEQLVTIFLAANAFASACEPIILSRLGLKRTVLFGALLLMVGSMVKSGGMPPIIQANLEKGHCETQIYVGFFLVGLSQPLYQCTPALLSASWFPEQERTMATGVALNANQLGIGFAFIFGTLLVAESDDIPGYFGLLSIVSTLAFFGTLFQFDDAPPTPPSDSARVMRGTLEVNLPSVQTILQSIGVGGSEDMKRDVDEAMKDNKKTSSKTRSSSSKARRSGKSSGSKRSSRSGGPPTAEGSRRRSSRPSSSRTSGTDPQAPAPSAALWGSVTDIVAAPSPMMPGPVAGAPGARNEGEGERRDQQQPVASGYPYGSGSMYASGVPAGYPPQMMVPPGGYGGYGPPQGMPGYGAYPPPQSYPNPNYQIGYGGYQQQYGYPPQGYQQQPYYPPQQPPHGPAGPYSYHHGPPRPDQQLYSDPYSVLPPVEGIDAGAEPVLTITPHHLDIDIRDDQILLAIRACFARPGFIHSLVAFTVSGIVINTLSTYMDYLVRLNGAGREYTGIIGGSFQVVIMISSLIIGGLTDKSRAYYSVTIGMLVIGAFGLAECGVSLNADRGSDLRVALIVVAALVGPLQPVSTELGVEVVYPLSENTVLVIQQLFSNLLSALFIPLFKELKDIGIAEDESDVEQPEYTFSFYLLIVLHAGATVFFATFNGRYLRYEHELQKKEEKERRKEERRQEAMENASIASMGSYQHSLMSGAEGYDSGAAERQPLVQQQHQIV